MSDYQTRFDALESWVKASSGTAAELERFEVELGALQAARDQEIELKDRDIAERRTFLERRIISRALTEALQKAGVPAAFHKAASALFREEHQIETDEDIMCCWVPTRHGRMTIADSVGLWLETEEGSAFLPERQPLSMFTAQIVQLTK
jgi:hypothetical protein